MSNFIPNQILKALELNSNFSLKADLNGNPNNKFSVAESTRDFDAVPYTQLRAAGLLGATFTDHAAFESALPTLSDGVYNIEADETITGTPRSIYSVTAGAASLVFAAASASTLASTATGKGAALVGTPDGFGDVQASLNTRGISVANKAAANALTTEQCASGSVFIGGTDGGLFELVTSAVAEDGGLYCGTIVLLSDSVSSGKLLQRVIIGANYPEWFGAKGDGIKDDTVPCQKALNRAGNIIFTAGKTYAINTIANDPTTGYPSGLLIPSNTNVYLPAGATLTAIPNNSANYAVLAVHLVDSVVIHGSGKIVGDRTGHTGTTGEYGFGVDIRGSSNISVIGLNIQDCWGDGILVGPNYVNAATPNTSIHISRCFVSNNRRNNISLTSVTGFSIADCVLSLANGTAPQQGIDIEPDAGVAGVTGGIVSGNYLSGNVDAGIRIEGTNGNVSEVVITGNSLTNNNTGASATSGQIIVRGASATTNIVTNNVLLNGNTGVADILVEANALFTKVIGNCSQGSAGLQSGIADNGAIYTQIENNLVRAYQQHGISLNNSSNPRISGNLISLASLETNKAYNGINLMGAQYAQLTNNEMQAASSGNTQGYGIAIDSTSSNAYLSSNILYGSGALGAISDSSTSTRRIANLGADPRTTSGQTVIADGGTITHNFGGTPTSARVTGSVAAQIISVTAISSTTFTVAIKTSSGAAGTAQAINWEVSGT